MVKQLGLGMGPVGVGDRELSPAMRRVKETEMLRDTELIEFVLDVKEWVETARVHTLYETGRGRVVRRLLTIEKDLSERMPEAYREHVAERARWMGD